VICSDDEEICQKEDLPEPEGGLSNIVVVDNLPVVAPEKYEKLEIVVRKLFNPYGAIVVFWMPTDPETQKTYGYCFIEYNTSQVYVASCQLRSFRTTHSKLYSFYKKGHLHYI
jgi:translation initiation factor 3 subunit B